MAGNPYIDEQLDAIINDANFVRSRNKMVVNRELENFLVEAKKLMANAAMEVEKM